jgi:exopolysaccharide biosynthesis polyprenyl glycosylphosphotransferase
VVWDSDTSAQPLLQRDPPLSGLQPADRQGPQLSNDGGTSATVNGATRSVDGPRQDASTSSPEGSRSAFARRLEASLTPTVDVLALGLALIVLDLSLLGLAYVVLAFVALHLNDPRDLRLTPRISEDLWIIVARLAIPALLVAPFALATSPGASFEAFALSAGFVIAGRVLAYALHRRLRRSKVFSARTLVVGAAALGRKLADTLDEHPEFGLRVVGFVDAHPVGEVTDRVLGSPEELPAVIRRDGIERVIVAYGAVDEADLVPVLRACSETDAAVYHVPRFFELGIPITSTEHEDVRGIPLVRFRRQALRRSSLYWKRTFDLLVSATVIVLASPVLALIALAVRATSPGPVLFRQVRIGKDGREFELLKFRTMEVNDDAATTWTVVGDPRLTSIGGFLRRTSLDELPQLFNILRGDMSLVGPRPERPHFVEQFGQDFHRYHDRHRVPVGLTGWSQVHGLRGDTPIEDRVRLDNYYIENWSPWLDLVIMVRTAAALKTAA